ncbi:MAG: type II toxin-antitoxin system HicA family toxin [Candidatus Aminicenantes bacterium]|nr:type II toxin-antitoxin system HicA family toxin [Candidatus Aminicenantes bacterium]
MPRITPQHYRVLQKLFEKAGFVVRRTSASHIVMSKAGVERPIVIPKYREVDVQIIKANLRTSKLSREEYFKLLYG